MFKSTKLFKYNENVETLPQTMQLCENVSFQPFFFKCRESTYL